MTRVKICGLTTLEDAHQAVELGAWALGMIFWPKSPRACPIEQAEVIGAQLHRRAELTGVFVNAPLDEVATTADVCRFSMLQLHGDEGPAYCREAARRTGCKIVKAARVRDAAQVQALSVYHTDFHLLDAHSREGAGRHGGELRLGARPPASRHAAGDPLRGADPRQRGGRDRGGAAVRGGHGERNRGGAGPEGPRQARRVLPGGRGSGAVVREARAVPAAERP